LVSSPKCTYHLKEMFESFGIVHH